MRKYTKPILDVLSGQMPERTPVWLMRQAGRYLPEYRELRQDTGDFLSLVYHPERAAEVTLQPIRRYEMDGAILFSDILVVPHALGQDVRFVAGEGPKLEPVTRQDWQSKLKQDALEAKIAPVCETVSRVSGGLKDEGFDKTTLIGFAGAPWTVACYMVQGHGSRDFLKAKTWAYGDPESFKAFLDYVTDATILYLEKQIEAGAEVIKIFDSWAGVLDANGFNQYVIAPAIKIVQALKARHPDVPIIGFPRLAGVHYGAYADQTGVDAMALDPSVPFEFATSQLQKKICIQGNLDPAYLLAGGDAMEAAALRILKAFSQRPFIFNLGHGVDKTTNPENVKQLVDLIRNFEGK